MGLPGWNILRGHAISYSKQKPKERNIKEKSLQIAYEESTKMYEVDPTDFNQNCWNETKEVLEFSIAKQQKVLLSAQELVLMNIEKET